MYINGKYQKNDEPILVMDFIRSYKLNKYVVYIAINNSQINMKDFGSTYIYDEDQIDFVFTVSGG